MKEQITKKLSDMERTRGKNVTAFQVSNLNYDTGFVNAGLSYEMKIIYEDGP